MSYQFILEPFEKLSNHLLYAILKLRSEIFVVEQNIVYLDCDGYDEQSLHLVLMDGEKVIGCARILPPGLKYDDAAIGRFVVDKDYRGKKVGTLIFQRAIDEIHRIHGLVPITIEGQQYLEKYYASLGFETLAEPYMLEGILHVKMRYKKKAS
jgi:ElaA protein